MERLALVVADCFPVHGVGLILTPGIGELGPPVRIGDELRMVRPDGTEVMSAVRCLHPLSLNWFLALPEFKRTDVPPGTAVWVRSAATRRS